MLGTLLQGLYRYLDTLRHVVVIIVPERNELGGQLQGLLETHIAKKPYGLPGLNMMIRDLDSLLLLDRRPVLLGIVRIINDDPVEIGVRLALETFYGKIKAKTAVIRWGAHHHQGLGWVHHRGLELGLRLGLHLY
jgi:hypothetical protein